MSSKNTSPLLSVRPRSVLASRPLLRGEGFGSNAWSATEYVRDTDRRLWSAIPAVLMANFTTVMLDNTSSSSLCLHQKYSEECLILDNSVRRPSFAQRR